MADEPLPRSTTSARNPERRPLFRSVAIGHSSVRVYGNVVLAQAISHRILTYVFAGLAACAVAFLVLFSTTRKVHCSGVLKPDAGIIRIMPSNAGRVVHVRAKDGQHVNAGDVLFVLENDLSTAGATTTMQTISSLVAQRRDSLRADVLAAKQEARQRMAATERRVKDIRAGLVLLEKQLGIQARRLALSEQALQRFNELNAGNFLSHAQVQEKQADLLDQRQRFTDLERALLAGRRDLAAAEQEAYDIAAATVRETSSLERNIAALEQEFAESEARREIWVRAPAAGTLTAITAEQGQVVGGNVALATLLPSGAQLEAELYVPSSSIGFIRQGMPVMLRYQAFPYQKFGQHRAHVREIANTSLQPDELSGAVGAPEPVYRIRLTLDKQTVQAYGRQMPLKSGMVIDASVMLEERRLYEWILEPLFSISGRM